MHLMFVDTNGIKQDSKPTDLHFLLSLTTAKM